MARPTKAQTHCIILKHLIVVVVELVIIVYWNTCMVWEMFGDAETGRLMSALLLY